MTVSVSIQSIAALVKVSDGDLRKAITFLQSAARLNVDKEITESAVTEIAGVRRLCVIKTDELMLGHLLTGTPGILFYYIPVMSLCCALIGRT